MDNKLLWPLDKLHNWDKNLDNVYRKMIDRCLNPNARDYKWYGAKGVQVCVEWQNNMHSFFEWARLNGYKKGLNLDRIQSNGDYSPQNCRFVTSQQNQRNRSNNVTDWDGSKRKCEICRVIKGLTEFHKRGADWRYECKVCRSETRRKPDGYYARRQQTFS